MALPRSLRSMEFRNLVTAPHAWMIQPAGVKFIKANLATFSPFSIAHPIASPTSLPILAAFCRDSALESTGCRRSLNQPITDPRAEPMALKIFPTGDKASHSGWKDCTTGPIPDLIPSQSPPKKDLIGFQYLMTRKAAPAIPATIKPIGLETRARLMALMPLLIAPKDLLAWPIRFREPVTWSRPDPTLKRETAIFPAAPIALAEKAAATSMASLSYPPTRPANVEMISPIFFAALPAPWASSEITGTALPSFCPKAWASSVILSLFSTIHFERFLMDLVTTGINSAPTRFFTPARPN